MIAFQEENFDRYYASLLKEQLERLESFDPEQYEEDPAGFITEVLGEKLTPDLINICNSVRDYPITIAKSGNGTGKSWISARLALWFYKCRYKPQVYCAAAPPQTNLENILWAEIIDACDHHKSLINDSSVKHLHIAKSPLEFIAGVSIPSAGTDSQKEARFGGKHAPSLMYLVDEGDAVPDPIFDGIETCLSGGYTKLLITFNPRQRLGYVYRAISSGRANIVSLTAFGHPNVITGENVIPGAVDRPTTLRRIAQWTRPLREGEQRDNTCYELPDFLVGCIPKDQQGNDYPALVAGTYKIVEHRFSHVVLGEYPAQAENQLISEEWIDAARSRYDMFVAKHGVVVPKHTKCTCGLDIADMGKDSSVLAKRFGNLLHPLDSWDKQDVIEVGDLVKQTLKKNLITEIAGIYCDGTGVGAGTAPYMTKQYNLPAVKVMVASTATEETDLGHFGLLLDQLMWAMREWLRKDLATLPPDPELIEELLAFTYEVKLGKVKVSSTEDIKKLLKRSPDRARSLMLTFMKSGKFSQMDLS